VAEAAAVAGQGAAVVAVAAEAEVAAVGADAVAAVGLDCHPTPSLSTGSFANQVYTNGMVN